MSEIVKCRKICVSIRNRNIITLVYKIRNQWNVFIMIEKELCVCSYVTNTVVADI